MGAHVALAGATALAWLGAGSLALAPLGRTGDRALDLLNRVAIGAVAFALSTFAAGWLGLLYRAAYLPLFAVAAAGGAVVAVRTLRGITWPALRSWRPWELALAALVGLYVAVDLVVTCAPISSSDALLHHVAAPERFAAEHRLSELEWSWNSYQPYTVEMLVLDGFLLWDGVQGAFAPLLLSLGGIAAVAGAGWRLGGRSVALLATAIYGAQPFLTWMASSAFVEPSAAFVLALAAWNLVEFARSGRAADVVVAGLCAGAAAGMKYFGAVAAAVLAATAAVALRRTLNVHVAAAFASPAVLVALPWYVKNAVLTGDPVYPLLRGWPNDEARAAAYDSFDNYGHGHSALDLVVLPVRLLGDAEAFDRGEFVSPLFLLFAPVALLAARGRNVVALALFAIGAYFVIWFLGVQDARYLLLALPPLAVLAAIGVRELARRGAVGRVASVTVTSGAFLAGLAITLAYAAQLVPAAVRLEREDEFLRENVSYHVGTEWLNANLRPDARIALGHVFLLHVDPWALVWTPDALPTTAGRVETVEFFVRNRLTHAAVLATASRAHQLRYVNARLLARVPVRSVTSRTLSRAGPPDTLLVYAVPLRPVVRAASAATPSAHASGVNRRASSRERAPNRARRSSSPASS